MYLEGPGRERRPVKLFSTEEASIGSLGFADHGPIKSPIEINVLADSAGNLARQVDHEGLRYKFKGSEVPWALIVG
jgi:hypothetical protein